MLTDCLTGSLLIRIRIAAVTCVLVLAILGISTAAAVFSKDAATRHGAAIEIHGNVLPSADALSLLSKCKDGIGVRIELIQDSMLKSFCICGEGDVALFGMDADLPISANVTANGITYWIRPDAGDYLITWDE